MNELSNEARFEAFCTFCGTQIGKISDRCPACGKPKGEEKYSATPKEGAAGIGYSKETKDKSFAVFGGRSMVTGVIVALIIGVVIALALISFGTNPLAAIAIGAVMFIIILIPVILSMRKKKSWEGVVVKKVYSPGFGTDSYDLYKVVFRTKGGKKKTVSWRTYSDLYDYLMEGDLVRYDGEIGGLYAFEKYDKSHDSAIPCAACGNYQDPRGTFCALCGCRLLKGSK